MRKSIVIGIVFVVFMVLGFLNLGTLATGLSAEENSGPVKAAQAVTKEDIESGLQNYAEEKATVVLGIPADDPECVCNIVGIVADRDTQKMIAGASIWVDGEKYVKTGKDGRFQIKNLPDGNYEWAVTARGYEKAVYLNYSVHHADGASIFTFYIDKEEPIVQDREDILPRP
ncbi:MAG: carboxypeptidase regulatory-like domain-containing protein [Clostridiales bacterium]|nr:carboxypeptidase regulatory-like domain-containing protein [Clostridiales bacterium]